MPDGDLFYVQDTKADGYAAVGEWFDSDGGRTGSCVNKLTAPKWGLCNKDLPENNLLYFHAARYSGGNLVDRYPYPSWNIT